MDRIIGIWALIFVRPMLVLGALVAAIGIALMLFAGSYFAVGAYSKSGLDDLTVTQEESGLTQEVLTRGLATPETRPMPTSTVIPTVVATTGPAAVALASTSESTAPSTTAEADQQETIGTPADEGASESTESAEDSPYDEYGILRDYSHYVAQADSEALSEGIRRGIPSCAPWRPASVVWRGAPPHAHHHTGYRPGIPGRESQHRVGRGRRASGSRLTMPWASISDRQRRGRSATR